MQGNYHHGSKHIMTVANTLYSAYEEVDSRYKDCLGNLAGAALFVDMIITDLEERFRLYETRRLEAGELRRLFSVLLEVMPIYECQ